MSTGQQIHPSAKVMKEAILQGNITVGQNTYIGAGAVISANGGKITIGDNSVIMENAIIRSTSKFNCTIGNNVLIGPKACITGATIHNCCFIATNGTIFHGAELHSGTVLAVNAIIHIDSFCPENTFIPISHIAFGKPVTIYSPAEIPDFHSALRKLGFAKYVYDIDPQGLSNADIYKQLTETFLNNLKLLPS